MSAYTTKLALAVASLLLVNQAAGQGYYATRAGGYASYAYGSWSTLGGGKDNIVYTPYSVIAGGASHYIFSYAGVISGGYGNTVKTGTYATIGGGNLNTALGSFATVSGGRYNTASGQSSFAVGQYGLASDDSSAVLAFDASNQKCNSMGASTVNVCVQGGLFVNGVPLDSQSIQDLIANNTALGQQTTEQAQVIECLVANNTALGQRLSVLEAQISSLLVSTGGVTSDTVANAESTPGQCATKPAGPQLQVEGVCSCRDDVRIGHISVLQWLSELNASVTSLL